MNEVQKEIERLFNQAYHKVYQQSATEAEADIIKFLKYVTSKPEDRNFTLELLKTASCDDSKPFVGEMLEYIFHKLRWPEIEIFVNEQVKKDMSDHRQIKYWWDLKDALSSDWEGADLFVHWEDA